MSRYILSNLVWIRGVYQAGRGVREMYSIGDKIVHPMHGAGIVDEIREELGYEVPIDSLEFVTRSTFDESISRSCWQRGFDGSTRLHVLRGGDTRAEGVSRAPRSF